MSLRPDASAEQVGRAARALVEHVAAYSQRDVVVETLDREPAATSPHAAALLDAGFRRGTSDLRFYR